LPEELDDAELEQLLFLPPPAVARDQRPVPDWAAVHCELRRPNVTLELLWEEYRTRSGMRWQRTTRSYCSHRLYTRPIISHVSPSSPAIERLTKKTHLMTVLTP
jgi:transposase